MKRKRDWSAVFLVLVFFLGLAILLYPSVSDWWNSRVQTRAIAEYDAVVSQNSQEENEALFRQAEEYNARLKQIAYPLMNYGQVPGYEDCFNAGGNGVMGYLTIEKIGVELPIYHGVSDPVLNVAAGHLPGTSLPTGGTGTHAVFSAHRGLPSARLFTDLDKLEEGDRFTVTVLDRVLTYQVDQIRVVLPDQVEDLYVTEGEDYCTLITCTPYGINTRRLLVRGSRVETAEETPRIYVANDAYRIDPVIVAPIMAAPMLLILLLGLLIKYRKRKR